jgi:hypothetical protein
MERHARRRGSRRPERRALTVSGWAALSLEELPKVAAVESGAEWFALQHAFGLTAFGANAFVATSSGEVLIDEHDEAGSGQEELYVVVRGAAEFVLDGASVRAPAMFVVAIRDPLVRRRAVALEAGTVLLALGGLPDEEFHSTWREEHFVDVPRLL